MKKSQCVFQKRVCLLTLPSIGKGITVSNGTTPFDKYAQFFYKEPVYKELALGWHIGKQLSGLNPLSLRNNKSCR